MNWKSIWSWLLLIWAVGIVAYSNTLSVPFVFDDLVEIVGNSALQDFDISALVQRYPTRITAYLTFAANYVVSGEIVASYHAVNILIHLLTATIVFFLVRELASVTKYREQKNLLAGACALLFVSHPIQTQAVTYIIQRLASLTALLYLTGLLLFVVARKRRSWNWLHAGSWLAILLAMFSKETAFTAPVAIVMIECFFFSKSPRAGNTPGVAARLHLRGGSGISSLLARWRYILPYLFLLLVIPLTLWFQRPVAVERSGDASHASLPIDRPIAAETSSTSRREYLLTQMHVVHTYLRLLILPINQNLDYDYPISHSLFETRTLGSTLLLLFTIGFGAWLYSRNRLASFGIFFFFLTLLVESSFVPIRDVIYEHRLYLPSIGIFLAAAALAAQFLSKRVVLIGALGLAVVLSLASRARNEVWQNEISLWTDVVEKSPLKARGHNNLGAALVKNGQESEAAKYFERAIHIEPGYAEAYNNLGLIKAQQEDYEAALELFKKAVELEPFYVHALNNMGVVYLKQGNTQEAKAALEQAVGLDDSYAEAKINLDITLRMMDL